MTLTPGQPHWSYLDEHKQIPITTTTKHAHNRNSPLFSKKKKQQQHTDESSRADSASAMAKPHSSKIELFR